MADDDEQLTPEEVEKLDEANWYARVYQKGATQLTLRAVLLGSAIGFALAFTNVYVGLKTSLHIGVNVTACILAYAITETARRVLRGMKRLSMLEVGCAVSTASSAGFATGNTLISAFPTLMLLKAPAIPAWAMVLWVAALAGLGVAMAVAFKRDLIDREKLKFPSGTAAAVMLHNLYRRGDEGLARARALLIAASIGAVLPVLTALNLKAGEKPGEKVPLLSDHTNIFDWIFATILPASWTKKMLTAGGKTLLASSYKLVLGHSVFALGAGVLVGVRTSAWMVTGGLFLACALTPIGLEWSWHNVNGDATLAIRSAGSAVSQLGPWIGAPMLVTSSFVTFGWRWRSIGRALAQPFLRRKGKGKGKGSKDWESDIDKIQVPARWSLIGIGIASLVLIVLGRAFFDLPAHLTVLAIVMTFFLASVASRVTGETDIAPVGPLGKVMQLTYGALAPRSAVANVQSASITSGASIASADLLNDVKTGHLLGADPRRQFIAQALGIIAGSIGTVIAFHILAPDVSALGDGPKQFAAPAAKTWKLVAQVMTEGLANVHPMHRTLIVWGSITGAALMIFEKLLMMSKKTERVRTFWPSATGIGIGMVVSFDVALGMLIGALIAAIVKKRAPKWSESYLVVVAAGAIAGESLISIFVYALNAAR